MKEGTEPMLNLKLMRIKKGLTQTELARQIGISQNSLSFYEIGKRSPRKNVLVKLAEALDCEIKDII